MNRFRPFWHDKALAIAVVLTAVFGTVSMALVIYLAMCTFWS